MIYSEIKLELMKNVFITKEVENIIAYFYYSY